MFAIELVEIGIVGGVVLGAIPPIPIAAFGDEELFTGELAGGFLGEQRSFIVEIACGFEVVPGFVIFRSSDPNVEIGVDPGAGDDRTELGKVLVLGDSFRDGGGFQLRIFGNSVV